MTWEQVGDLSTDDCIMWFADSGHTVCLQKSVDRFYQAGINLGPAFLILGDCETLEEAKDVCKIHSEEAA